MFPEKASDFETPYFPVLSTKNFNIAKTCSTVLTGTKSQH